MSTNTVTFEEMESKRQEMLQSFKDIAAAMTRCVSVIEDYARLSPSTLTTTAALAAVENGAHATQALINITEASGKKRSRKEKKPKDPNAPKRPPSAYLLFQNDIREDVRQEHPGKPYKEILSVIAERWKLLSEEERKVYENAYTEATATYRVQDEAYRTGQPMPPGFRVMGVSDDESSSEEESDAGVPEPPKVVEVVESKKEKKRKTKDSKEEKEDKKKSKKNKKD